MQFHRYGRALVVSVFILAFALALYSQGANGSFTGTIRDSSGAIVPGANVTVTNADTGTIWQTKSNDTGVYILPTVPPGNYSLAIEAPGFKRITNGALTLEVDQVRRMDYRLEIGAVSETVEVSSTANPLQTESTQLGTLITGNTTVNLPLNGRNFAQLTLLAPGVVNYNVSGFTEGSRGGGQPLVNGNRAQANNYIVDGMDANETEDNGISYAPNVDAIQEFKLITTNPPAEYGNSMGAIVNTSFKSGTNEFHGDVFEFLRNDKLDANSWFGNATRQPRPHFTQNIFGGVLGGPIKRNRLFFFADYQGWRRGKGLTSSVSTVVPTAWRSGDFRSLSNQLYNPFAQTVTTAADGTVTVVRQPFAGNQIPQSMINPVAANLFSSGFYPLPLLPQNANNWNGAGKSGVTDNQGDVKIDYNPTSKDYIYGRLSIGTREAPTVNALRVNPGMPVVTNMRNAVMNWSHTFSPRVLNEARAGINRLHETSLVADTGNVGSLAEKIGIPGGNSAGPGLPSISIAGMTTIGTRGSISIDGSNVFQYTDSLTFNMGRHLFKAGVQFLRYQQNRLYGSNNGIYGFFDFNSQYTQQIGRSNTGSGVADFLLGFPDSVGKSITATWGQRSLRSGYFIQDDWKARDNLTINLGLRYEYNTPYIEVADRQSNFDMNTGKQLFAGQNGNSRALYNSYKKGFQPRFGLAWTPSRFHNRTVVRMAYGILNYLESTGTNRRLPMNPPYVFDSLQTYDNRYLGQPISSGFPVFGVGTQPSGSLRVWPTLLKPSIIQQWNFTIEQQLGAGFVLSAGYVGQDATHLTLSDRYWSQAVPGSGPIQQRRRSYRVLPLATEVVLTDPVINQNYQGMQLNLRKHLSAGLELTAGYTWSHAMSGNAGFYGTTIANTINPQDYNNLRAEWGPASMDIRQNFISSFNYELPFGHGRPFMTSAPGLVNAVLGGWAASGVLTIRTGFPLTIGESSDISNTGSSGPRPNAVTNANLPSDQRSPNHWFDTLAFALQAPGTFGNVGTGTVRGPGMTTFDFGLQKRFAISERRFFELRAESFNLANTPVFNTVGQTFGTATFGTLTSAEDSRELQFGLKFNF
jgi:hypothetical protein